MFFDKGIITLLLFSFSRLIVISNYTKIKQTHNFSIIIEPNITNLNKLFLKPSKLEVIVNSNVENLEVEIEKYFKNLLIFLLEVELAVKHFFTSYTITRVLNAPEQIPLLDDRKVR